MPLFLASDACLRLGQTEGRVEIYLLSRDRNFLLLYFQAIDRYIFSPVSAFLNSMNSGMQCFWIRASVLWIRANQVEKNCPQSYELGIQLHMVRMGRCQQHTWELGGQWSVSGAVMVEWCLCAVWHPRLDRLRLTLTEPVSPGEAVFSAPQELGHLLKVSRLKHSKSENSGLSS